jgi:hypothetical protein
LQIGVELNDPSEPGSHACQAELGLPQAVALYSVCFAALAWPWLSGRVTIPWDAKSQFQPALQFLATSLARGESPFWTPYAFAGWPQIADPQSLMFSPLHLLLTAVSPAPSFRAADAVAFAYLFIGGLGLIMLFRHHRWSLTGAVVAALMFGFGGVAASRIQHTGQIISLAYIPLALWLLTTALDRRSWRWGVAAGVVTGLLAAGRDQVALLGLYLLAGRVLWDWLTAERPFSWVRAHAPALIACGLAAALVAAVPLVMTELLAAQSNRPQIEFTSAGRGSLHPMHALTLVFSDLFGAADPHVDYWGPPSFPWKAAFGPVDLFLAQNMGQLYAGIAAPILIIGIGVLRGALWEKDTRFFTIALALAALYAVGWYTPAFRLMYDLFPGIALFRRPADAAFVFNLLLAICAGYLLHRWLSAAAKLNRSILIGGSIVAAVAGVLAIASAVRVATLGAAIIPIVSAMLRIVGAALVMLLAGQRPRLRLVGSAALVVLVAADLAWNNAPNESAGLPPATYDALRPETRNETVALLRSKLAEPGAPDRRDRVELTGIAYHWPSLGVAQGFDSLFGQNPLRLRDFARATGVGDTVAVPEQRTFSPLFPSYRSTMADLLGLRWIATGVPVEQIDRTLEPGDLNLVARTADAYVYENPRALPRVMFVSNHQLANFDALLRDGWPEIDPQVTMLLERPPAMPNGEAGEGSARLLSYANTEIVTEVETTTAGFLVLNDIWHPWWRATVDGMPAEILKANVLFRAVRVPPGQHRVGFVFSPFAGAWDELRRRVLGP